MRNYIYAPMPNQLDGIMQPINPLMGSLGQSPVDVHFSPMVRSDVGTPTVDLTGPEQFAIPALNGGLGAVADALSVLSVVDLLTRG